MRHSHQLVAGLAAIVIGIGMFAACVGDSQVTNPDATTEAGGNDVNQGDSATGCAARTADDTAGLFVAQTGNDVSSCGTRANPCKTLTYTIALGKATTSKTTIYVAATAATDAGAGVYLESITLDTPLTIEGGWNDNNGTWTPICNTTTSTAVTIQGVTNTTITASFTGAATLRDVKVISKPAADSSESLYGIFALGTATNLTLDQVVVDVGAGGAGVAGINGAAGANANDAGCAASSGGNGAPGATGGGGGPGTFSQSGYVVTNGGDGGAGAPGLNGVAGGSQTCQQCQAFVGNCPATCGFGTAQVCSGNGRSGCGGSAGTGGSAATGGGASIAVYVWDAHVTVFGGNFASSNGGNGANGGSGADGGSGTVGAAGANALCATSLSNPQCGGNFCTGVLVSSTTINGGAAGGAAGAGGVGGQGGGGGGGVTYAIVQGGDGGVVLNSNPKLAHGTGGVGGLAGGTNGLAADRWP